MIVLGALSSFRELGKMSPHKRASRKLVDWYREVGLGLSEWHCFQFWPAPNGHRPRHN
jgi:hypothetical protein